MRPTKAQILTSLHQLAVKQSHTDALDVNLKHVINWLNIELEKEQQERKKDSKLIEQFKTEVITQYAVDSDQRDAVEVALAWLESRNAS